MGSFGLVAVLVLSCSEKQKEAARLEEKMRNQLYADSLAEARANSSPDTLELKPSVDSSRRLEDTAAGNQQRPATDGDTDDERVSDSSQVRAIESPSSSPDDSSLSPTLDESAPDASAIPDEEKIKILQTDDGAREGRYAVQIASTPDRKYAEQVVSSYTARGYQAYLATALVHEITYYRIRIGMFSSSDSADRVRDELVQKFGVSGFVTRVR